MSGNPENNFSEPRDSSVRESEEAALRLDQLYPSLLVGEVQGPSPEGGSVVQAYELILDPGDERERRGVLVDFCLRAVAMGYQQAFPPVTLNAIAYRDIGGNHPLSAVYFFLSRP